MWHFIIFVALATLASTPARADWEWTRWGMSQREARLAAPAPALRVDQKVEGSNLKMRLAVDLETAESRFVALLGFSQEGKLGVIELRPADDGSGCARMASLLAQAHGEPVSQRRSPNERLLWADNERGNLVEFSRAEDGECLVRLAPLPRRKPYLAG